MKIYRLEHLFNDILNSLSEIESFYALIKDKGNDKIKNMGLRAIEREIQSIASQWNKIQEEDEELVLINIVNLIKLNRRLKSAYIRISSKLIFSFVESEVPQLKNEIESLIDEND